jgi:hypothetical protein
MDERVRALCEIFLPESREYVGLHEYDGGVQDLSPAGVQATLARIGGPPVADHVAEAHISAFEDRARIVYGELEQHRRNPLLHLMNLDLACYDREYAPADVRAAARRRHLQSWPDAIDGALESLVDVPGPVAEGLTAAMAGLDADLGEQDDDVVVAARDAHKRLMARMRDLAEHGDPDPAIGSAALARLMGAPEAMTVDLGRLALRAESERDRLMQLLSDSCARLDPGRPAAEVVEALLRDHPDADGVIAEATRQVEEVIAFTRDHHLAPYVDGECRVGPAPPSRRWAMAMMSPAAPYEDDGPSWYHITPPDPSWPPDQQEEWLSVFSAATLPVATVHEVAPGHFAHGRSLRRTEGDVRKCLQSMSFVEGWAHYSEELCLEEGFRADDIRFAVGVAVEALVRVTRLAVAIGLHTGAMTMDEAIHRFETDALLAGPAAESEAARATFDPGYGCYTFGKLEILALRDEVQAQWGLRYSNRRFHEALLEQGAPPLGLMAMPFAAE